MAVQYAKSFGANVSVFATSESKRDLAFSLGAKHFYNVKNSEEMQGLNNRFSFILSTVVSSYEITEYTKMLKSRWGNSDCRSALTYKPCNT